MSNPLSPLISSRLIFGTGQRVGSKTGEPEVIALPAHDIFHALCLGKSGYGKSRWLCSFAIMLLSRNIPFFLIDNTGDLSRLLLHQLLALGYFSSKKDPFSTLLYLDIHSAQKEDLYLSF